MDRRSSSDSAGAFGTTGLQTPGARCDPREKPGVPGSRRSRALRLPIVILQLLLLPAAILPGAALAQAWLPDQGTFSYSVVFSDVLNREHYLPHGNELDVGHTRSQSYGFLFTYSPTDRLMLTAGIPYVRTRYWGPPSHGGAPEAVDDDGEWHADFTDFRISAHYQLMEQPFAFTPLIAVVVPSHDYGTFGHAAHGRNLNELWLGAQIGKNLSEWIPRTYAQARYTYAFVQEVADVKHDRSNLNLELGGFITPNWNLSLFGAWQVTHGGIDVPIPRSNPLYEYHDVLAADEYFNLGLGTGFSITQQWSAFATYMQSMHGRNGHKLNQGLTVGLAWGYRPREESGAADF